MSALEWDADRPWARQPFDTEVSFALFGDFLTASPPRHLGRMAERAGYPAEVIRGFAKDAFWVERAALWDEHLAEIRTSTIERVTEESAAEVAKRQLALTRRMQRLANRDLSIIEKQGAENDFLSPIEHKDLIRLAVNGIKLERLIMGETTDKIETGPDLSNWSIEDLRALRELQAKAGVR